MKTYISTSEEVISAHMAYRARRETEEDIAMNYAPDVVVIDRNRVWSGHDGIRESARILNDTVGEAGCMYERVVVADRIAHLVWYAAAEDKRISGVDTFLIEHGKIKVQTISCHG